MPIIRPISDLRNKSNEISELCRVSREPVFITKNGVSDMVVLSVETYERQQAQLELYAKLAEAEASIAEGEKCEDFNIVAEKMRKKLIGKLYGEM
jgi:prevent-host-death family protein